jgi:ankyrin repeat protein
MNRINQELIEASSENNLPEVRRLLSVGADVNAKDNDGSDWTPLIEACYCGHLRVVKALREHGADIEAKSVKGLTPLHLSVFKCHLAVVNELLSPSNGTTTILGKRKSRGGANTEAKDTSGDTSLHVASWNGHLAIVKALVSGGADILAANDRGELPTHQAVRFGNTEVAKYLLQQLYATTLRLPLHKLLEDLTWIPNHNSVGSDIPPLWYALHQDVLGTDDVVEIIEYLVGRNPALLSARDKDGSLPLHLACHRGAAFPIVQSLVNLNKASVKSVTSEGDLPLFLACKIPEPSLDTIFILMKMYPDLLYGADEV